MAKTIRRGDTEMKVSSLNFQVKEIGVPEDRTLRFIGSDDTPDRDGDVVTVEGWDLKNYLRNPVFLWAHDYSIPPVGKSVRTWRENGKLMFDIQFPEKGIYPFADLVYNLYKGGFLNATSVGFVGKEATKRDDPGVDEIPDWKRGIKYVQQELLELSAVPVPSNPAALQQAKSVGAVTDDEYASLMSFINGEFVQTPHVGAKTLKGIQNVYESQEAEPTTTQEEVASMKDDEDTNTEKQPNVATPLAEQQFSFVLNPASQKTLLMDNTTGKILGDITAEVKTLITQAVKQAVKTAKAEFESEEKAGAVLSKKNKSRLSQAKDLIIEVLGQVEDEESMEDQKRPTAVLEDEEELNKPEDTSMNGKKSDDEDNDDKPSDPDVGEDGETADEEDKKKKSADEATKDEASQTSEDDDIEFDFETTGKDGEYELPEDVADIIKQAVAGLL